MAGIETDDITQGMAKYLLAIPEIVELVGKGIDDNPDNAEVPWIFQDSPGVDIEGTQQAMIVVAKRGGWSSPNTHNRAEFPRMMLEIWVDPLRDATNNVTDRVEARRRANYIFKVADRSLHIPGGFDMMWGGVRVIASVRSNEFDISPIPQGDGAISGSVFYNLSIG